jgi:hypothetical protein
MFECISGNCVSEPKITYAYTSCEWKSVPEKGSATCPYGKVMVGVGNYDYSLTEYVNKILCCELRIPG